MLTWLFADFEKLDVNTLKRMLELRSKRNITFQSIKYTLEEMVHTIAIYQEFILGILFLLV